MLKLYKFYWDWGHLGGLSGLFISGPQGCRVVHRKDRPVRRDSRQAQRCLRELEEDDLTVISDDQGEDPLAHKCHL